MISLILYLVYAALPLALSCYIYKNSHPRFVRVWRRLVRSENARKLVGKVLTLYIAMLHIVLYAVFPKDMGLIASTMIMLALFSTNRSLRLLEWIRSDKTMFCCHWLHCDCLLVLQALDEHRSHDCCYPCGIVVHAQPIAQRRASR
jgi:hypothetical protein